MLEVSASSRSTANQPAPEMAVTFVVLRLVSASASGSSSSAALHAEAVGGFDQFNENFLKSGTQASTLAFKSGKGVAAVDVLKDLST